ncbi:MAG: class I mannose-6-phosphate isomerase [Chitinispirillaceae bacterium]|nr:class I mannose-6-phosphate isomerase [Chitinispirillaceae bacterium]
MTIPIEPLFFHSHYKEKIWGGQRLSTLFGKSIPQGCSVGESWELSAVEGASSVISRGSLAGRTLTSLYSTEADNLLGCRAATADTFPLLIKFIDAHDRLSVQVHPDDVFARKMFGEPSGKTECWYIADAGRAGAVALGLKKEVSEQELLGSAENGSIEQLLNIFPVKTGEVYFVPARTIHAILNDVVIYEVQQNSDTTLRLYDWMRTDADGISRPLQVKEAVQVADRQPREKYLIEPLMLPENGYEHSIRVANSHFALEEFFIAGRGTVKLQPRTSCRILTFMDGDARCEWELGSCLAGKGETLLLPAAMGVVEVSVSGRCLFLMTTIPELQTEIMKPLEEARYTVSRIAQLSGDRNTVITGDR